MIIKEISTQGTDENNEPLYLYRNSEDYTIEEWKKIVQYLKRNKKAGLLKWEVLQK